MNQAEGAKCRIYIFKGTSSIKNAFYRGGKSAEGNFGGTDGEREGRGRVAIIAIVNTSSYSATKPRAWSKIICSTISLMFHFRSVANFHSKDLFMPGSVNTVDIFDWVRSIEEWTEVIPKWKLVYSLSAFHQPWCSRRHLQIGSNDQLLFEIYVTLSDSNERSDKRPCLQCLVDGSSEGVIIGDVYF